MKKYLLMMSLILLAGCSDEKEEKDASANETAESKQVVITSALSHDAVTEEVVTKTDDEMVYDFLNRVNLYYEDFKDIYNRFSTSEASNDKTTNLELADDALKKQDELIVIPFLELQDMEYQKMINRYYDSLVEGYSLLIDTTFGSYQVSKKEMTQEEYSKINDDLRKMTKMLPNIRSTAVEYFNERAKK